MLYTEENENTSLTKCLVDLQKYLETSNYEYDIDSWN